MVGKVRLRKVKWEDLNIIYEWRNDPEVRKNSFSQDEIKPEEHNRYWLERLAKDDAYSFIVVSEEEDVGLIRLDKMGDSYEVHIMIAPDRQGKGFGTAAIAKAKETAKNLGIEKLIARVKPGNIASEKIFTDNGFVKKDEIHVCRL